MKKITFFGSGVELKNINISKPEMSRIVEIISVHYDKILYGGTNIGLMGEFAKEAKNKGLKIKSVVTDWLSEEHNELIFSSDEINVAKDLSERKEILTKTDAVLIYPGGIGTMDELFDLITKISFKEIEPIPIIIYNFERYYSPLLLQIEYGIKVGTIKKEIMDILHTFEHPKQLKEILEGV